MLDAEQQAAVACTDRWIYLQAGPGSGKTRTLVSRIARLLREGVSGHNILAITFTRRAAMELRERVARDFAGGAEIGSREYVEAAAYLKGLEPCTLHALALRLLRQQHPNARAMPLDEADAVLIEAARDVGVRCPPSAAHMTHSTRRRLMNDAQTSRRYLHLQHRLEAYGYETLESLLFALVRNSDAGRAPCFCWDAILVDESQDLNPVQQEIVLCLAKGSRIQGRRGAVFAVGDDVQSIFGWRGADPVRWAKVAPWTRLALTTNYRSGRSIVVVSRDAAEGQPALLPMQTARRNSQGRVYWGEIAYVSPAALVSDIRDNLLNASGETATCAVLARTWYDLERLKGELDEAQIDAEIARPDANVWRSCGMLLVLAVLRAHLYGDDLHRLAVARMAPSLAGVPLPEVEQIDAGLAWWAPAGPLLFEDDPNLWASVGDAIAALDAVRARSMSISEFLEFLAQAEEPEVHADVVLMTAHAAKGLEFDHVWWLGHEHGLTGEEQRVQYVAMTRARNRLALADEIEPILF